MIAKCFHDIDVELTKVVYTCSSWLQLASGSRDLSQAEKRRNLEKSQLHIFTLNQKLCSSRTILTVTL